MDKVKSIDPRTTRRRVPYNRYVANSAMYSTYEVVGYVGVRGQRPIEAIIQKKAEFCKRGEA